MRTLLVGLCLLLLCGCDPVPLLANLLLGGIAGKPDPLKPEWKLLSDGDGPPGRSFTSLSGIYDDDTHGYRLIVFGGKAGGSALGDVWIFELESRKWKRGKDGPARWGHGAVFDNFEKVLWVFGGQNPELLADTWKYDPAADQWSEVKFEGEIPRARYGHSTVFYGPATYNRDRSILVSHGFATDGRHDDTWLLNLETKAWTDLTPAGTRPVKRCLHSAGMDAASGIMYLFGGCASGFGDCPLGDLWTFNPHKREWTEIAATGDLPAARTNAAFVVDYYDLFLHGGTGASDELFRFDVGRKQWEAIATGGPGARSEHVAIAGFSSSSIVENNGELFVFGGIRDGKPLADLWVGDHMETLGYQRVPLPGP